ncbi:TonB-dependent receptor family protein [Algoriphagus sp.]|uniref:TonB-dependent receptor family protein n=1 Tax=Algoriphagus sp. TaxID=1872435 RepID=UPI003919BAF8
MTLRYLLILCFALHFSKIKAQQDTLQTINLNEYQIKELRLNNPITPLPNANRTFLVGSRKSEIIGVRDLPANLAEKTGRQIFAKIPSAFVYDMDGSGNQINLSLRGLDAHRSWEFNVRQNGIMLNSDIYGYPASHYSMPMEAIERIEIVRGTAALQYGQQFGGMINYVLKEPETGVPFSLENISTVGSFGLLANYTSIGGTIGRFSYFGYYQKRGSDGYREGARSDSDAQHIGITYAISDHWKAKAELSRSTYLYQIPGPLTDQQFAENPRQATRSRNFYSPEIFVPAVSIEGKLGANTTVTANASGVFGGRSSVTFDAFANVRDQIIPGTGEFAHRNVDTDAYHSRTAEVRILHKYQLGTLPAHLSISTRYFNNSFDRRQRGKGTTGSDYDLSIEGDFQRDVNLHSESLAIAVENQVFLNPKLSVSPGIRVERGNSVMSGRIAYIEADQIPQEIRYDFVTLGLNATYQFKEQLRLYGGISQANRPILFQDLIPGSPLALISPDLENTFGYNAELGIENYINPRLTYHLTLFHTLIGNRVGNILVQQDNQTFTQKANIGDSRTTGLELLWDWEFYRSEKLSLSFYTASSWMDARYQNGSVASSEGNKDITGNRVEAAPKWISRNGLSASIGPAKLIIQHQYISESFSDPLNTKTPPASGSVGMVPSYNVWDIQGAYYYQNLFLRASLQNVFDKSYFTRRPLMYPGPGIWPSDGRGLVISLGFRI